MAAQISKKCEKMVFLSFIPYEITKFRFISFEILKFYVKLR